ncbi:MAG: beta-propeller fold lactonase family protein [Phycisphaerae bacterium]|nr:beta-propeller fold lactonase family protein [Phycisphaerae bacterium]
MRRIARSSRSVLAGVLGAAAAGCLSPSAILAQSFQLIVTVSPPGSNTNPAFWQPVKRFEFAAPGADPVALDDIPANQVADPAGAAFRTERELFIGNRHGNVLGMGSISRFTLSADGQTVTPSGTITAPGMIGVHEVALSPTTGELFATTVNNGIFRFTFDDDGNALPNGSFAGGQPFRGVAVHPNGRFVYATSFSSIIRVFRLDGGTGVTELPAIAVPNAINLHYFVVHPNGEHLYVCDIVANRVTRYRMGLAGELQFLGSFASPAAIDAAFSPDAAELFVGNHFGGGITRYQLDQGTQEFASTGFISTSSMGGFAIYTPRARPCFPDFNGDGNLDPDDLSDYIACYFTPPCPQSDYNADGNTDPDDLSDYIADYFFGCS